MRKDLGDKSYHPEMPRIDAEYLIDYLFEISPASGSIEWPHIDAWCNRIGIDLRPWESRFLLFLSREYTNESHRAEKFDCPAPWESDDLIQERREAIANKVRAQMRSFVNVARAT
jgi:hypothetical protein